MPLPEHTSPEPCIQLDREKNTVLLTKLREYRDRMSHHVSLSAPLNATFVDTACKIAAVEKLLAYGALRVSDVIRGTEEAHPALYEHPFVPRYAQNAFDVVSAYNAGVTYGLVGGTGLPAGPSRQNETQG